MHVPLVDQLPAPPDGRTGWPWTEGELSHHSPYEADSSGEGRAWPKISIVTPSYNQGPYLEETIRSVLLQGYPNLEYFVVDGGSEDESVDILRRYDRFLTWWVSERDRGQTDAINKGLDRATGEIFAYLNSDDIYEAGALFSAAQAYRDGHEWIAGDVRCWDAESGSWPFPELPAKSFAGWFLGCPISQPGCFWSARLHREVGPFREDLHYVMDYEFWLRLRIGKRMRPLRLRQPTARYRLHSSSKSMAHQEAMGREIRQILPEFERYLTRAERSWLRLARRHRSAIVHGRRSITHLKQRRLQAASGELFRALKQWPLLFVDPGVFVALKELFRSSPPGPPFPDSWTD